MAPPQQRLKTSASEGSIASGASRMTEQRREKLEHLKRREDLKGILRSRLQGRFGRGAAKNDDEVSVCSSAIAREVDQFAVTADVTEANLARLERRLAAKASCRPQGTAVSSYSCGGSVRSRSAASIAGQSVVGTPKGKGKVYDWHRLDEYASYLHEQDSIRQRIGTQALQRKLRMDLDSQVADKYRRKQGEKDEDQKYHETSMQELERWKESEAQRKQEFHDKIMKEKSDRDEQLQFERQLKAKEAAKKEAEESSLVEKIVTEMENEQIKFEKKKEATRAKMRAVFEENIQDQKERDIQKREQAEREAHAMKEYNRILDDQEETRARELEARMERQKTLMDKLMSNVQAQATAAGNNDEMRANAQQEEMDRHYFEAENAKQTRLKQMRLENQAYLLRQMREKDGRNQEEKMLQDIQCQILERDTEEYNEVEKQKVLQTKARLREHQKDVQEQMELRKGRKVIEMSDTEVALNKPLLDLVDRSFENRDRWLAGQ